MGLYCGRRRYSLKLCREAAGRSKVSGGEVEARNKSSPARVPSPRTMRLRSGHLIGREAYCSLCARLIRQRQGGDQAAKYHVFVALTGRKSGIWNQRRVLFLFGILDGAILPSGA